MTHQKQVEVDVSELDNEQFQWFTLQQEITRLENEKQALFDKMFQVVGKKIDMEFDAWRSLNPRYLVCDCKVGEYLQTISTIYKRVA